MSPISCVNVIEPISMTPVMLIVNSIQALKYSSLESVPCAIAMLTTHILYVSERVKVPDQVNHQYTYQSISPIRR